MRAIAMAVVICGFLGSAAYGQKSGCETDREVYNRIVQIEGKVTIINRDFVARGSIWYSSAMAARNAWLVCIPTAMATTTFWLARVGTK